MISLPSVGDAPFPILDVMKTPHIVQICLVTSVLFASLAAAQTPIVYNRALNDGRSALFRLTQDTDTQITTGLNEADQPTVSHDGRFIAVTAADGPNTGQLSQDVWVLDTVQGTTTKLINNSDQFDPRTQASTTTRPVYKAFSPDDRVLAVSNVLQSTGGVVQGQTNGVSTVPQLVTYQTSNGAILASIHLGMIRDGSLTEFMGVDWLPQTGEVISPVAIGVAREGTGIPANTTAIVAFAPITDAGANGRVRQITRTRAWAQSDFASGAIEYGHHNDFFPASSPSGRKIAFFRSVDRLLASPQFNGNLPSQVSLRTINADGTDEQVLWNFPEGQVPTGVSWSADGNRLIVGMGAQVFSNGVALKLIDPSTGYLAMIPSGGGDLTVVGVQGSANPMWSAATLGGSNTGTNNGSNGSNNGNNNSNGNNDASSTSLPVAFVKQPGEDAFILRAINAQANADSIFLLQTSSNLQNWTVSRTVNGETINNGVTIANSERQAYYRLVKQ